MSALSVPAHWPWSLREKAEEEPFFSWPLPSSSNLLSDCATADVHHCSTRLQTHLSCTDPILLQNVGQISPCCTSQLAPRSLCCLQAPSSPSPESQHPSTSPSVYPVFSGSHSSHTHPLSGRDSEQRHSTNFCPPSSMPPYPISLSPILWLSFLFCALPLLILAGHMCLQGFHNSRDISITSQKPTAEQTWTLSTFCQRVLVCSHAP